MRGEIAKGAAWTVLFRLFDRSVGLISTAALARLLVSNDFDLLAMAKSIVRLSTLFTAIHIRSGHCKGALWRPLVATGLIGWVISALVQPAFSVARVGSAVAELLAGILIGLVMYPLTITLLWRIGGAQDAVEAQVFRHLLAEVQTRRAARRVS